MSMAWRRSTKKSHKRCSPGSSIQHITNGVHSWTWTCDSFKALYDRHIPGWGNDPSMLRHASSIPTREIWQAHMAAKTRLFALIEDRSTRLLAPDVLTIGFARRAPLYKRADLLFADVQRLLEIAQQVGPVQLVFAGKAHSKDAPGKEVIRHLFAVA